MNELPMKKKWISGLLAFFVPGIGHFYLGQMAKGIAIMLLIAFDICAIVFAVTEIRQPLIIVLLSLLLPIMYFYSLFDAIQSTDAVNQRRRHPDWQPPMFAPPPYYAPAYPQQTSSAQASIPSSMYREQRPAQPSAPNPADPAPELPQRAALSGPVNATGVMVLVAVVMVLVLATGVGWSGWMFRSTGSMAGAVVLIGAGIGLWIWERRSDRFGKR